MNKLSEKELDKWSIYATYNGQLLPFTAYGTKSFPDFLAYSMNDLLTLPRKKINTNCKLMHTILPDLWIPSNYEKGGKLIPRSFMYYYRIFVN